MVTYLGNLHNLSLRHHPIIKPWCETPSVRDAYAEIRRGSPAVRPPPSPAAAELPGCIGGGPIRVRTQRRRRPRSRRSLRRQGRFKVLLRTRAPVHRGRRPRAMFPRLRVHVRRGRHRGRLHPAQLRRRQVRRRAETARPRALGR